MAGGIAGEALDFSRDSRLFAAGLRGGAMQVLSLADGRLLKAIPLKSATHRARIPACVRFHPATNHLAECSASSQVVQIWNWETGDLVASLYHASPVLELDWHPYGDWLATGCTNGEVWLWPLHATNREPSALRGHLGAVSQLAFSHTGELLASLGAERQLRLWAPATGRHLLHSVEGAQIESLAFSTDGQRLGFGRAETQFVIWETAPPREYRVLTDTARATDDFENLDFSPDGRLLVASGEDGLLLWDVASGKRLASLPLSGTRTVRFHPASGDLLASRSEGLYRWAFRPDGTAARPRLRLAPMARLDLPEELGPFALSSDGQRGAVIQLAGSRTAIHLFEPVGGGGPVPLPGAINYQTLALSPDGRYLAARARPPSPIHVWGLADQARVELAALDGASSFTFSPDGQWLVVTARTACQFWRVGSWEQATFDWMWPGRHYGAIGFAPQGGWLAVAGLRSPIELLRWPGGQSLATLESPDRRPVHSLAFSRDGGRLAASTTGRLIQLWDLALLTEGLAKLGLQGGLPTYSVDASTAIPVELELETAEGRAGSDEP